MEASTGRHRHVGGVGNQHGAFHQRIPGFGVYQFREFVQNVRHLIAALPQPM